MQHRQCFLPPEIGKRIPGHPTGSETFMRHVRQLRAPVVSVGGIQVYTAGNREVEPGTKTDLMDARAKEAYDGLSATFNVLKMLNSQFGSGGVIATVHYGNKYDNAFWDGTQMVFGDGDGQYFKPFTGPIDVCGHELFHGVTGDLLNYSGQAGALNESMSDCAGAVIRQTALRLAVDDPNSWLIGAGLFTANVKGRALRDMLNPGTAYDDGYLGKDPQPADMTGYVNTTDDDGGVHTNSGIPNRAFALASQLIGDSFATLAIWERALAALNNPDATFEQFANATIAACANDTTKRSVQGAWETVRVLMPAPAPTPQPEPTPTPVPVPGGTPDISFLDPTVQSHIKSSVKASRTYPELTAWLNNHFRVYFKLPK
jgi:Zn-dependent metalloprotease